MYSDDSRRGLPPANPDLGHVLWQGIPPLQTTVNPADLSLAQPSHGLTQSHGIPRNVAPAEYGFVGYPPVDHTSQGAPVCLSQSMGHTSGQCSVFNGVPAGHFTGHPAPVVRVSQGPSICQWMSEDGLICGQLLTYRTVPKHLAEHGIQSMHRNCVVQCHWNGCGITIKRQSITRHCREVHLGMKRKSHNTCFLGMTLVTDVV